MRVSALAVAAVVVVALSSQAATAVTPKKWYWSEARAEAFTVAKVRIPFCRLQPSDRRCIEYTPHLIGYQVIEADCRGTDELRSSFKFNRFSCRVVTYDYGYTVQLAIYVTGLASFRWKIIG